MSVRLMQLIGIFLQLSLNKIIYKIFGGMAKDSYGEMSEYFLVYTLWSSKLKLLIVMIDSLIDIGVKIENYVPQALIM